MSEEYCPATGKIKYRTPQKAHQTKRRLDKRTSKPQGRSYLCSECKGYHLTSAPKLQP